MSELDKLQKYLEVNGYVYSRTDEVNNFVEVIGVEGICKLDRHQIIVYDKKMNRQWDAICHYGSYGYKQGLLEVSGCITSDDVEGYLTAQDIINRLKSAARK